MPEQHMGRSHLTSIPIDICAYGSSLSVPSNLTPPLSSFFTPTLLHTHKSLSSTCPHKQPGCADTLTPLLLLSLASPAQGASFRPSGVLFRYSGYKPSSRSPLLPHLQSSSTPGGVALHRYPSQGCRLALPSLLQHPTAAL